MKRKFLTKNSTQTKKLAEKLAIKILQEKKREKAFVIGLEGELGAGKTTFLQGFAKGLSIKERILSPTFILMRRFSLKGGRNFYHLDCYRIAKAKEVLDLGFKDIILGPQNIVAVEWAGKIKEILPKNALRIKVRVIGDKEREVSVSSW